MYLFDYLRLLKMCAHPKFGKHVYSLCFSLITFISYRKGAQNQEEDFSEMLKAYIASGKSISADMLSNIKESVKTLEKRGYVSHLM